MGSIYGKMVNIISENGKLVTVMEKEYYIILMEKLSMKEIMLMKNMKEMENIYGKMVNIIQESGKMA